MATEVSSSARDTQPYNEIAIVFVTFPDGFGVRGTASLVGQNDILTALHVVYSPDHGGWAKDLDFYFGADYNDITSSFDDYGYNYSPSLWDIYGKPDEAFVNSENQTFSTEESANDIAIIGVNTPIGDTLGWLNIQSGYDGSYSANSVGYPSGATGMMSETVSVKKNIHPGVYTSPFYIDTMGPGSSGGPLLIDDHIVGVKSTAVYWADIGFNFSPLIDFMDENNLLLPHPTDIMAPTVTVFTPADEAMTASIADNITLLFSEKIQKGTGDIYVKTANGTVVATYDVATSTNLSISGSTLTINPSSDLSYSTEYRIEIDATAIKDLAGNSYAGTFSYNFTTITQTGSIQDGTSGNDSFLSSIGPDVIDGGAGLDTVVYSGQRSNYQVIKVTDGLDVIDIIKSEDTDVLKNIERLSFSDKNLAFDMNTNENAGITAKILGAVFGKDSVANKEYVGIGLDLLDGGMSHNDLLNLAINANLGINVSNVAVVNLLYTNVVGIAPPVDDLAYFVELLDSGAYTVASLGQLAADTTFNTNNINLVGLATSGLEFV